MKLRHYSDPRSIRYKLRRTRFRHIVELLTQISNCKSEPIKLVDLGGTSTYWGIAHDLLKPFKLSITIINTDDSALKNDRNIPNTHFDFIKADVCDLGYEDNSFDVVHSNSVIEHVGDWMRVEAFASNVRRLAPAYYVQTPSFWFPYEPHFQSFFFHWLPEPVRARRCMARDLGFYARCDTMAAAMRIVQSARLIDRRQMSSLFPDATIVGESLFGITKSLLAIKQWSIRRPSLEASGVSVSPA